MAFVNLDSIHHYQPPPIAARPAQRHSASQPLKGRSAVWNRGPSTVSSGHHNSVGLVSNISTSANLQDYNTIEWVDLTTSLPTETLDPFREPALGFGGMENAQDSPSIGPLLMAGEEENDDHFPSLEELLGHAGEAQKSLPTVSIFNHSNGKADNAIEHPTLIDCDNPPTSGAKGDGDKCGEADGCSRVHPNSDGSISEEQGGEQSSPNTPPTSVPGSEVGGPQPRTPTLREKTNHPISGPPPLLSPRLSADTVLSSISGTQKGSRDGAFNDFGPGSSDEGKEKADTGDGHNADGHNADGHNSDGDPRDGDWTATGATGIQVSSKRTAGDASLNQGGEGMPVAEKVRRIDSIDETDGADEALNDLEFARLRSLPKPVFRMPPSWRNFQQREKTTSSSRSSRAGESQNDPLLVEDDEEKTSETGASTRATSVESEIGNVRLQSSHPREQPKTQGCLSLTVTGPITSPFDRPISPTLALSRDPVERAISRGDCRTTATVHPLSVTAATPPSSEQPLEQGGSALDKEDWEIVKILGKRRTGRCNEYKVHWKSTWLRRSELGNAQQLLREFEAKGQAQQGYKEGGRRARPEKGQ